MGAIIICCILGLLFLFVVYEFNKFVTLKNKVKQAKSTIEVYLNQRFDLIPNLVECVKGYMTHEQETFTKTHANKPNIILTKRKENILTFCYHKQESDFKKIYLQKE